MYLRMIELKFQFGWYASEIRDRIESDLLPELTSQLSFLAYYVVEADENRLATVRVFHDFQTMQDAMVATNTVHDAIVADFSITAEEVDSFSGEVYVSA